MNGAGFGGYFLGGRSSIVKSIQSGTITVGAGTTSQTATITSVDTTQSMLIVIPTTQGGSGSDPRNTWVKGTLTNATTITATINADAGFSSFCNYQNVEFLSGTLKSAPRGTISLASGGGSATATVTSVDTTKTFILNLGITEDSSATSPGLDINSQQVKLVVTNATTFTASRNTAGATITIVSYQGIEAA